MLCQDCVHSDQSEIHDFYVCNLRCITAFVNFFEGEGGGGGSNWSRVRVGQEFEL